ncbi:MAG: P1 family peptidase [Fidelibacterota bacterium]
MVSGDNISITDIPGVMVGHAQNAEAKTGCTVILTPDGAVGGVDIRGSAPGTREVEILKPVRLIRKVHGVLLTGGSAFGLDATGGVQKFLEEKGIGYDTGVARIPIVPTAVIFDLRVGDPSIRPDREMGYAACLNASTSPPEEGLVGAGIGASAGAISGFGQMGRGGLAIEALKISDKVMVGVLVVVNPFGNVIDSEAGEVLVGTLDQSEWSYSPPNRLSENTTLAMIVTNARLTVEEAVKISQMSQDGVARAVIPSHTMFDGDISFCLSTGDEKIDLNELGNKAAELVTRAIVKAVRITNRI